MQNNKCVFLDRDGVLNVDRGTYTWQIADFEIAPGVPQALIRLKNAGYYLIVVTNQAGIAKGLYTEKEVWQCHQLLQEACHGAIDDLYFSPYHPDFGASLGRKPGSLLFEKAIAKYGILAPDSWMVGDQERDLIPAQSLGIKTIRIRHGEPVESIGNYQCPHLTAAADLILSSGNLTKN